MISVYSYEYLPTLRDLLAVHPMEVVGSRVSVRLDVRGVYSIHICCNNLYSSYTSRYTCVCFFLYKAHIIIYIANS